MLAHAVAQASGATGGATDGLEGESTMEGGGMDVEELEIAWECLETARVILSKLPETKETILLLARVMLRLGDHGQAGGNFEAAINDYRQCLVFRERSLPRTDRLLADVHTALGLCYM